MVLRDRLSIMLDLPEVLFFSTTNDIDTKLTFFIDFRSHNRKIETLPYPIMKTEDSLDDIIEYFGS